MKEIFWAVLLLIGSETLVQSEEQHSQSINVAIEMATENGTTEFSGTLRALPFECESVTSHSVAVSGEKAWQGALSLDTACQWDLVADILEWWAPVQRIPKAEELPPDVLRIPLYPASAVTGTVRMPTVDELPESILLELQSSSQRSLSETGTLQISCPLREKKFQCVVPAGEFNLKLTASGYVPQYHWGIDLHRGTDYAIDPWELELGASLAGWVEFDDSLDGTDLSPAITLQRQISGWLGDPTKRRRMDLRRFETTVDEHGFFQIAGVSAGGFRLRVEEEGFIPLEVHDLAIKEGQELVLEDPLVLMRPIDVEVAVSPPVQPSGEPWRIEIALIEPGTTVLQEKVSEAVPITGLWTHRMETLGNHKLTLSDAREQIWAEHGMDVQPGIRPVFVEIPLVEIVGQITMGDEPLETKLVFGSTQGARQITMISDSEGRFEGFLPKEGVWPIDLVVEEGGLANQALPPVTVERKPGSSAAFLDIKLPGAKLTGEVLKGGEAVAGARLVLLREENGHRRREGIALADEEGHFALWGVAPGTLWVHAYTGKLASPWTRMDIVEGLDAPHIRLDMEEKIEVSGFVLSPDGEVPGAQITALSVMQDGSSGLSAEERTDFDGGFSLSLPRNAVATDLVVSAPGYGQQLLRVSLHADQPNHAMIQVRRESGELVFRSSEMVTGDQQRRATSTSTLHYNGTALPLRYLLTRFQKQLSMRDGGLGLLTMPLGEYRLCNAEGSFCEMGYLNPNGELWMNDPPMETEGSQGR